jgi:hypothetical protein
LQLLKGERIRTERIFQEDMDTLLSTLHRLWPRGMEIKTYGNLLKNQHILPPRSTAGQLTLDQHIGVRIPGGQPNQIKNLRFPTPSKELAGNIELATFHSYTCRNAPE